MGYAVYEDQAARDMGVRRWAGYGVPAECDWPDCKTEIDRGLGYRCESHVGFEYLTWPETQERPVVDGCELSFCEEHRYETSKHADITPKPDSREWIMHQLIDPSWAEWRNRYPDDVRAQQALLAAGAA